MDVYVIADVPRTQGDNVPTCLAEHDGNALACAVPRAKALPPSAVVDAARAADDPRVRLIDLDDQFCNAETCFPVVGRLIVYRDFSHLSGQYAAALAPYLEAQLKPDGH